MKVDRRNSPAGKCTDALGHVGIGIHRTGFNAMDRARSAFDAECLRYILQGLGLTRSPVFQFHGHIFGHYCQRLSSQNFGRLRHFLVWPFQPDL